MKPKESNIEIPTRRPRASRNKIAALALAGASVVGGGLLLAERAGDSSDKAPANTGAKTESTAPTDAQQPEAKPSEPTVSEAPQPTEPSTSSTEVTLLEDPIVMTPTPVEPSQPNKG